jgi:hypothetical protein
VTRANPSTTAARDQSSPQAADTARADAPYEKPADPDSPRDNALPGETRHAKTAEANVIRTTTRGSSESTDAEIIMPAYAPRLDRDVARALLRLLVNCADNARRPSSHPRAYSGQPCEDH